MSARHLGETFDIHGGGKDLVFPHHENEIAQSRAASGKPFVNYWLHNGFVNVDSEKMSKSLGNFFTIADVLLVYHPEAIRTFLLSTHYRSPINYSNRNLEEATGRIEYMYETLGKLDQAIEAGGVEGASLYPELESRWTAFLGAMDDDFNTAAALGHLFELFRTANELVSKKKKLPGRISTLRAIRDVVSQAASILGVLQRVPGEVLEEIRQRDILRLKLDTDQISARIQDRIDARKNQDWSLADGIRAELAGQRIALMDSPEGTTWKVMRDTGE
jgi:cysteinyl-tRNA synthetase